MAISPSFTAQTSTSQSNSHSASVSVPKSNRSIASPTSTGNVDQFSAAALELKQKTSRAWQTMVGESDDPSINPGVIRGDILVKLTYQAEVIAKIATRHGQPLPRVSGYLDDESGELEFVWQWEKGRITAQFSPDGSEAINATKSLQWWPRGQ